MSLLPHLVSHFCRALSETGIEAEILTSKGVPLAFNWPLGTAQSFKISVLTIPLYRPEKQGFTLAPEEIWTVFTISRRIASVCPDFAFSGPNFRTNSGPVARSMGASGGTNLTGNPFLVAYSSESSGERREYCWRSRPELAHRGPGGGIDSAG